uniref:Si:ch211-147k10.5 n=1 Tax=Neogobius melanostomus TaxID=47308 RepID=A0A8C6S7M7_9GOBI
MMGSFRRPRPRFMSSPVLSDLARFYASSSALQLSNTSAWNSVQSAVMKVFQGGDLQPNELYSLNESIRCLLKTEMGSFITDYFQIHGPGLCGNSLSICVCSGEEQLDALSVVWERFFTETLPTLQAIFYPVQGQELSVRQMSLLAFRDLVLLKLHLEDTLGTAASVPPAFTQMLLVLQGIHEPGASTQEYFELERLVEIVVSPYLSNICPKTHQLLLGQCSILLFSSSSTEPLLSDSACLAPLVEQEGEAYLEKSGGVRRHTVATILSAPFRPDPTRTSSWRGGTALGALFLKGRILAPRPFSSQPDVMLPQPKAVAAGEGL